MYKVFKGEIYDKEETGSNNDITDVDHAGWYIC